MKSLLAGVSLLALAAFHAPVQAMGYPALDTTSHWSLQNWGFSPSSGFYLQGAGKDVWTAPGKKENLSVFYNTSVVGVRLNGKDIPFTKAEYLGQMEASTYLVRYASFNVLPGLVLTVIYYLHDKGEFETHAYFQGAAFDPKAEWELVQRLDYDLTDAGNNIAEFLWSPGGEGGSISPPQYPGKEVLDGRLTYAPAPGSPSYWAASSHEITVAYPPLGASEGAGAENPGFARILTGGTTPQFGMILWGDPACSFNATFRAYSFFDGNFNSTGDPTLPLQLTSEGAGRPRTAYSGRDQLMFVRTKVPAEGVIRFRSKLFQRPSGSRPISIRVFQHPADDLGGWVFDPDYAARTLPDGPRTFRKALQELVGGDDVTVATAATGLPYLPYEGFAGPGQPIGEVQLHSLLSWARSAVPPPPSNGREFQLDIFLVNWDLQGEADAWESVFDYGGADLNRVSREATAVFWPRVRTWHPNDARAQSVLTALYSTGLALNMHPAWSNCPFTGYCWNNPQSCGGYQCGPACPPGAVNCRYRAYSCENECTDGTVMSNTFFYRNLFRFNTSPAAGSKHSEVDWYRQAPESWVKPGRFGISRLAEPQMPALPGR